MDTPLNASSMTAGALLGGGRFNVPEFQREYAWRPEEVNEFFRDLAGALGDETYFLGLVIVTGNESVKDIVDGQQRLLTLSLLASAVYHEAIRYERRALADHLQSTFLRSVDFATDEERSRLTLSSPRDNAMLQAILETPARDLPEAGPAQEVADYLRSAYTRISQKLADDLREDPFRRLGSWAEFLTSKLYFAVFVHPNPASAYRVFEVINTRGRELTTADLLKSYVLSQTAEGLRARRYGQWQQLSNAFLEEGQATFVQFIRHAVTVQRGHVPPRDLYDVLIGNRRSEDAMSPTELMQILEHHLPLYLQIADPTAAGSSDEEQLGVFSMLNSLSVISVRPILLAIADTPNATEGMTHLLRLVMQRVVTGTLGTGNVERRFGVTARSIAQAGRWEDALADLEDLRPLEADFERQAAERSLNRHVLGAIRASVLQNSIAPDMDGTVYFIKPRNADWSSEDDDRISYWVSTLGNTFISTETRRPMSSSTWEGFKRELLPTGVDSERETELGAVDEWGVETIIQFGKRLAAEARQLWYE